MALKSRKLYIWLIGLGTVFFIYILYGFVSRTAPIDVDREFSSPLAQKQIPEFGGEQGVIGDAKVGTVTMAKYRTADREFGFVRLLHKSGDMWEIEKPYMKVFQPTLRCDITAATGMVDVEMAAGRPNPKNAKLSGDVTIHIFSNEAAEMQESYIYLDELDFVSERSEFSTDGPVRFVSQQAEMVGTGLRLVYDEVVNQLVLLKIVDLDFLHLKEQPGKAFLAGDDVKVADTSIVSDAPEQPRSVDSAEVSATPGSKDGQYYKCVFSNNVAIEYGRQLIFADQISINNLSRHSSEKKHNGKDTSRSGSPEAGSAIESVAASSQPEEAKQSSDDHVDIHVTCENGIVVTPMKPAGGTQAAQDLSPHNGEALFAQESKGNDYAETVGDYKPMRDNPSIGRDANATGVLRAERIDYDILTGNVFAAGSVDFTLARGALDDWQPNGDVLPAGEAGNGKTRRIRITADREAQFLSATNEVVFKGNVVGNMLEGKEGYEQTTKVFGEKLTAALSNQQSDGGEDSSVEIERARVTGGTAKLDMVRTSPEGFRSGTELKCAQIDYDKLTETILATGPGLIKVDNSNVPTQQDSSGLLGLKEPCYALIDNFDKLHWLIREQKVVAESVSQDLHIGYLPVEGSDYGLPVTINTSHIDVRLSETNRGRSEISTLTASGGIYYSEGRLYEFVGSKLFYDGESSVMRVEGEPGRTCLLNGVFVDDITYDLTTGSVQADIAGAGALIMKGSK